MSVTITYPFDSESNYIYDSNKIEIVGGKAKLKLVLKPDDLYTIDFSSDIGFTYDNTKAEFINGKLQQIDQRPVNSICAADFSDSLDLSWAADGFADLTGNLNGSPVITGGKLDCTGGISKGIYYEDSQIGALSGDFVAKFKYTPNYNNGPAINSNIFTLSRDSGLTDVIAIFNSPSGNNLRITANGLSANSFGSWNPIAGQEYVFEIFCIANIVTLFIDGVQLGLGKTISPSQGILSNRIYLGAHPLIYNIADAFFDDFILYSSSSQDINYNLPPKIYAETTIETPQLTYSGAGTLQSWAEFNTIDSGPVRYTVSIDGGPHLHWNGVAWVASNETYNQANNAITFNNNLASIDVNGATTGIFKIYFPNRNTILSVDNLEAKMIGQIYPQDDSSLQIAQQFNIDALINFEELVTKTGTEDIKYILKKNSDWVYWDGSAWIVSDETFSQSNSATEIVSGLSSFASGQTLFGVKILLRSVDGLSTPSIQELNISYDFSGSPQNDIFICSVYWYVRNPDGSVCTDKIKAIPSAFNIRYKDNIFICQEAITVIPDVTTGYVEINLIENVNMVDSEGNAVTYKIEKDVNKEIKHIAEISVPETAGALLWDILI